MMTRRAAILNTLTLGAAMAIAADDLTDLFTAQPAGPAVPMMYRQGVIQTWNPVTLENTVLVGRTIYTNLNVIGVGEVASFREGVTVAIVSVDSSWGILGRFCIPGTDDAEDAITQIGQRALTATVLTQEATSSSPFVDLATPGPAVTARIAASGKAFVTVSAQFDAVSGSVCAGTVGVAVSGDTTIAATTQQSLILIASNAGINASRVLLFSGLPAGGICTFTMKYGSNGVVNMQFSNRDIIVETK